jgi:hypothetical protein
LIADCLESCGDQVSFQQVILAGSVLPRRFPWAKYFDGDSPRVGAVWNEVARWDVVVRLAGIAGLLGFPYGCSGATGFKGDPTLIGNVDVDNPPNIDATAAPLPRLQNVTVARDHRFASVGHIYYYWLPFLWGLNPLEYEKFIALCANLLEYEKTLAVDDFSIYVETFERSRWSWTRIQRKSTSYAISIRQAIRRACIQSLARQGFSFRQEGRRVVRRVSRKAIRLYWVVFGAALGQVERESARLDDTDEDTPVVRSRDEQIRLRGLDPKYSFNRAVRVALEKQGFKFFMVGDIQ